MIDTATRSRRKASRGGVPNTLFVCASAEDPPPVLSGTADTVQVLMPWGSLLSGVVEGRADVCGGLRKLARVGAALEIVVGTDIWRDPVPNEIRGLPELTTQHVRDVLVERYAGQGWHIIDAGELPAEEAHEIASSWSRRLAGSTPNFFRIRAEAA